MPAREPSLVPLIWLTLLATAGCASQPQPLVRNSARFGLATADMTQRPECVRAFAQAHQTRGAGQKAVAAERRRSWTKIDWQGCASADAFLDHYFDSVVAASVELSTPPTDRLRTELSEAAGSDFELLEPASPPRGRPVYRVSFARLPVLQLGCVAEVPGVLKIVLESGPCTPRAGVERR